MDGLRSRITGIIVAGEDDVIMYKTHIKRLMDIIVSLLGLPFFLIIFAVVAPMIYFSDKGSVFYNAERIGYKGKVYKMFKFRSMKMNAPDIRNADGSTFNSENDPRVTKIGRFLRKTSLDETPQILNVLKGDMSIIGPRPNLPSVPYNQLPEIERKRLDVRPGITGYNQAYFRNSVSSEEKFKNDVKYVETVSFAFDIRILFKTIESVIKRENINTN